MAKDILRYDKMIESAMRGVVRQAISEAAKHGLPGAHHFYISFRTDHPGTTVPDYLKSRYPQEMTIKYHPEDPCRVEWAAKCWVDEETGLTRLNLYYPEGIEKFVSRQKGTMPTKFAAFERYEVPGEP